MAGVTRRQLVEKATEIFGSKGDALAWLNQPAIALGQRSPVSLLDTERGRQVVSNLLTQPEYGVYI